MMIDQQDLFEEELVMSMSIFHLEGTDNQRWFKRQNTVE